MFPTRTNSEKVLALGFEALWYSTKPCAPAGARSSFFCAFAATDKTQTTATIAAKALFSFILSPLFLPGSDCRCYVSALCHANDVVRSAECQSLNRARWLTATRRHKAAAVTDE